MNAPHVAEASRDYLTQLAPPLVRHFDLLASAPQGVARLRELILSLAVRGKLVPQDPADEPASVLLERIRAEKDKLIAEGKIKKGKPLAAIPDDEKPFELMAGWSWVTFGGYCSAFNTGPFGSMVHKDDYVAGGIPFINPSHMVGGWIVPDLDVAVSPAMASNLSSYRLSEGDVVLARRGEVGRYALVTAAEDGWLCGTGSFFAKFHPDCNRAFLGLLLKDPTLREHLQSESVGSTMTNLNQRILLETVLGIPPAAEQARIVAKVEELMVLCDLLEEKGRLEAEQHRRLVATLFDSLTSAESAHELAESWQRIAAHFDLLLDRPEAVDALEQTVLQLAVRGLLVPQDPADEPASRLLERIRREKDRLIAAGKIKRDKSLASINEDETPFELPNGWGWGRLGEVTDISSGVTLGRKTPLKSPVSLPYLRVANVQRWKLVLQDVKEVVIDAFELERFQLRTGDLLMTEGGDWDKVGRTCIWRNELPTCLHQNHVFKVRRVFDEWQPLWAELYLNSTYARAYFASSAKQTTNLASINMTQLKSCVFPIPPLTEQARIIARVEELRRLCADLRAWLSHRKDIQRALSAALVEQVAA